MVDRQDLKQILSTLIVAIALPPAAVAGTNGVHELRIAIDDGTPDGQLFIDLDDRSGVDLRDLQIGESQSVVDGQGRAVLVTRTEQGLTVNVDGRVIDTPDFAADIDTGSFNQGTDIDIQKEVVIVDSTAAATHEGITIISSQPIDDATRETLRAVLLSAGHSNDIVFLDGEGPHSETHDTAGTGKHRQIRVISQEINATN